MKITSDLNLIEKLQYYLEDDASPEDACLAAVYHNDLKAVKYLYEYCNKEYFNRDYCFKVACAENNLDIALFFVDNGTDYTEKINYFEWSNIKPEHIEHAVRGTKIGRK